MAEKQLVDARDVREICFYEKLIQQDAKMAGMIIT